MASRSRFPAPLSRLLILPLGLALACGGGASDGKDAKASKAVAKQGKADAKAKGEAKTEADTKTKVEGKGETKTRDPEPAPGKAEAAPLEAQIAKFAVAELSVDVATLSGKDRATLTTLIEAAKLLDPVFDRQAWAGNPALEAELAKATDPVGKAKYAYFRIMRGPWDRQNHREPFAVDQPWPKGAGYYPEDLSVEEFEAWLKAHPGDEKAFKGLHTIIARDGDKLVARPYSEVFKEWLEPAAAKLREAAGQTDNASLATFLNSRADAFGSDDYYQSDKDWMDLDSRVEITIGPYETYEDELMGLKASFEAFVTVSDPEASEALAKYKSFLPKMEDHLPVDDSVKTKRGAESPIRVVDLVFSAGDARKSVQTVAFNLPNDERVRREKGAKKVLLRNSIQTKFDLIMKPIAERVLDPSLHDQLSGEAFFNQVLFHELSHSLGPAFTTAGGEKVEVRIALGPSYTALEECKADTMGAYNTLFMIDQGQLPKELRDKVLVSYFAGLFRSVRFGVAESHGQGAAVQINRYVEGGGATFDEAKGVFTVDTAKLEQNIEALVRDLVMLQHEGDKAKAEAFLAKYGVMSPQMDQALGKLGEIPVDLRPVYPVAGETGPR